MGALSQSLQGLSLFLADGDLRRRQIREVCEELGIEEDATWTDEQRKHIFEGLTARIVKGAFTNGGLPK